MSIPNQASDTELIDWLEENRANVRFDERAEQEQLPPFVVTIKGIPIGEGDTWRSAVEDAIHNTEDCR